MHYCGLMFIPVPTNCISCYERTLQTLMKAFRDLWYKYTQLRSGRQHHNESKVYRAVTEASAIRPDGDSLDIGQW